MRTHPLLSSLAVFLFMLLSQAAEARRVHYLGAHPIAARYGGGYCYIEAPHLHGYSPDHAVLYQQTGDGYVFTGDPTPFGYDGERHLFYGHHPVVGIAEPVYCFLDGPHYHPYAAPAGPGYQTKGGVAFYVGPFTPTYAKLRPHRVRVVNAEYLPFADARPVVEVEPPPEWQGVSGPVIAIAPPRVAVQAPRPRFDVEISAPSVVIAPPAPHVWIAPPAPHVWIAPPAPHVWVAPPVVVGPPPFYAPGPRMREREDRGERGGREEGEERHDHGKHKGWFKHERD